MARSDSLLSCKLPALIFEGHLTYLILAHMPLLLNTNGRTGADEDRRKVDGKVQTGRRIEGMGKVYSHNTLD